MDFIEKHDFPHFRSKKICEIFENFEKLNLQNFSFCYENLIFLISFPPFHRLAGVIKRFCQRGFENFSYAIVDINVGNIIIQLIYSYYSAIDL